jgi:hypothetical protein
MLKQPFLVGTAIIVLVLVLAAASPAAGAGTTQVGGVQTPVTSGPCYNPTEIASFTMNGSLEGCWYTDNLTCQAHTAGTVQCTGNEHFVGSIGRSSGTLYFSFQFSGKYGGPPTFPELHGRCHHPVIRGDGDFSGATGVLDFQDDVTTGCATYTGHITL